MAKTYDSAKIVSLLESTLKPGLRKEAEDELMNVSLSEKIPKFPLKKAEKREKLMI